MRRLLLIAAVLGVAVAAGCGGSSPAPTTTVASGTVVDSGRYLADAAAGAAAVRAFAAELATVGSPATRSALTAVAARLQPSLDAARLAAQRLSAERLADARLEEQRGRTAPAFAAVVAAMERVQAAAAAGDPASARTAARELSEATAALGALGANASAAPSEKG